MDEKKGEDIARRLEAIKRRYPELDNLSSSYMHNYENAHREVANVFRRMDRDIRDEMMAKVYVEIVPVEEIGDVGYFDESLTDFGEALVLIRFCCGFVGNLAEGRALSENECAALMFAYECHWYEGDDFLLGNVVENLLRRIGDESRWGWPADADFKGQEKRRQFQWLGREIALAMKELARYHRNIQPGHSYGDMNAKKPALRNFRAIQAQINAAAKERR